MRRALVASIVLAVAGCGDDGGRPPDPGLCAGKHLPVWTRSLDDAGGAVTFSELMVHPRGGGPGWVELHNPLAIPADLSGWRLAGAVELVLAEGTLVAADGYLVIAADALPASGGAIELWNNAGRLMDVVRYGDGQPWPEAADGTGASLVKRVPSGLSESAEAWAASAQVGGTPGAPDDGPAPSELRIDEVGGAADPWLELTNRGAGPIALDGAVIVASGGGEYAFGAETIGPGQRLVIDAATLGFAPAAGETLALLTGGRRVVADGVRLAEVPRARDPDGRWRYPDVATPGEPNVFVEHDGVVISELLYHAAPVPGPDGVPVKSPLEWIELANRGDQPVDVGGWQLVDAVGFEFPAGTTIAAGGRLVITGDRAAMTAAYPGVDALGNFTGGLADGGDRIELRDACGNPVDEVAYRDGAPWPAAADGGGSTLELRDLRADNAAPEAWAAGDQAAPDWQTIQYEGVAAASAVGPDGQWQELVLGLLDAGEVWIDDVSVVVDPATAPVELITDGGFEGGGASFRAIGNHRRGGVIEDPGAPGNHVLRLVATGPTEHMHNHVETTLAGGHRITNGRTYRISLRARWISGSDLLNTRLYFARLARTTTLAGRPTAPGTPGAPNRAAVDDLGPTYRDLHHAPAVPAAGEPVEVSVTAADPDGVAGLTLWYARDGGAPTSVAMTAAGDRYTATVPGGAAGSVVQFWVEGADTRAATSMAPAAGPDARALWRVDDGAAATNGLHNLRIVTLPADATWLFTPANLMSNDLVGCTVIDGERDVYYDAGVRLKSSERGRPSTARVGFALRFPTDRPLRGVHGSVLIDRSQGVGFGQRELWFWQAMNHGGTISAQYDDLIQVLSPLPAHVGPAHLQLVRFGARYLDTQFAAGGDGDLFEYELIYYPTTTADGTPTGAKLPQPDSVVGTAIRDLGNDEESYRLNFMIKANRWRDDYRGFVRFAKVFGQTGAAFDGQVADVIDVDEWLRSFAIVTLSGAVDNYGSNAQHNADFFVRPADGRVVFLPHDMDFLGGPHGPVVPSSDLARLIAVPARARVYYGHLNDLIATSFNGTYLAPWSQVFGALLPGQDFAGALAYATDRAGWVMSGAPNSVLAAIPRVSFAITTASGTVAAPTATVDGVGWVDVAEIRRGGAPLALTWTTTTAWRATVPLACGANPLQLDAVDRRGGALGTGAITLTRTGAGC